MNNEFMWASFLGHRSNQHWSNPCHAVPWVASSNPKSLADCTNLAWILGRVPAHRACVRAQA